MKNKIIIFVLCFALSAFSFVFADNIVRLAPLTISIKSSATTITTSATPIPATALAGRESIAIINNDVLTTTVYIGGSDVTTANGFPLNSTTPSITLDLDDSVVVYGIVSAGTADIRALEAK